MQKVIIDNLQRLGWIILAVFIGTGLDYVVHTMSPHFEVPGYYFTHKLIYATLLLLVGLGIFWRVRSLAWKSVLVTAFFAIGIQLHYAFTGYALWFVFFFMAVHFVGFLIPIYLFFRRDPVLFGVRS